MGDLTRMGEETVLGAACILNAASRLMGFWHFLEGFEGNARVRMNTSARIPGTCTSTPSTPHGRLDDGRGVGTSCIIIFRALPVDCVGDLASLWRYFFYRSKNNNCFFGRVRVWGCMKELGDRRTGGNKHPYHTTYVIHVHVLTVIS